MSTTRQLSKTSAFSAEIMMIAPADLVVTNLSSKYRDLRKDLLTALTTKAWGVRIHLTAESTIELKHQIRNLVQAGASWTRSIKLESRHGLILKTHTTSNLDANQATMDMYFVLIEPVAPRDNDE